MRVLNLLTLISVIAFNVNAGEIKIVKTSTQLIEIEANFLPDELNPTTLTQEDQEFNRIRIESEALLFRQAGLPEIPQFNRWLVIDSNARYKIEVTPGRYRTLKNILLYPTQPDSFEGEVPQFSMNKLAYMRNKWYGHERAMIGKTSKLGGLTLLPVSFFPASYHPVRRELRIYESMKIKLTNLQTTPPSSFAPISQFAAEQSKTLTLNGTDYLSKGSTSIQVKRNLILLHSPLHKRAAEDLAELHESEGDSVTTLEVNNGVSSESLKKTLLTQYETQPFDAVLIFGDESMIPLKSAGGELGDFSYGLLSGNDQISDVAVGRIPAKTETQGKLMVNKIRTHLQLKANGVSFKKVMLIAHRQDYPGKYTRNLEKIRTSPNPKQIEFTTQYGGEKAQNSTVIEEAQKGFAILNYRGHGSTSSWSSWGRDGSSFNSTHLSLLPDNENGLFFIFNVACSNGSIQSSTVSLAERELFPSENELSLRGAVGTFGATAPSMTETNHRFNQNLFDAIQTADDLSIGNIYTAANNKLTKDNGGSATSNTRMYILFSDPLIGPLLQ